MMLAGTVALSSLLESLAATRPIFHSEADFQHALCWTAHLLDHHMKVRLETHPEPNVRLDILLESSAGGAHSAVELKYLTRNWSGEVSGERFMLRDQGAQDVRAYDVVKDISRVERFVAGRPGWNGAMIALTNDPAYWRPVTHGRQTNAEAFRLYDGVTLSGVRAWGPHTGRGTMRNRQEAISLTGQHRLRWFPYSCLDGPFGEFRILAVPVG